MAGNIFGAQKTAATKLGLSIEEYLERIDDGKKWCYRCNKWKMRTDFSDDTSRGDKLKAKCRRCAYQRKRSGPSIPERHEKRHGGLEYCCFCEAWLPASKVKSGKCRTHQNQHDRQRYANNEEYRLERRQHVHSRKRNVEPIPVIGQENLMEAFNGFCAYCQIKPANTWDHITPIKKGGMTVPWNIVPACNSCNSSKSDNDLDTWLASKGFALDYRVIDIMSLEEMPLRRG